MYDIRLYKEGEEIDIISFINQFTMIKHTYEGWLWEYTKNPIDKNLFAIIRDDNNNLIATQALIPIFLTYRSKIILSAKSESTLVHPEYRGKNLFSRVYKLIFEILDDISCIWGFTGALKPFKNAGFEIAGHIQNTFTPLKFFKALHFFSRRYVFKKLRFKNIFYLLGFFCIGIIISIRNMIFNWIALHRRHEIEISECAQDEIDFDKYTDVFTKSMPEVVTIYRDCRLMSWWIFNNPYREHKIFGIKRNDVLLGYFITSYDDEMVILRDFVMCEILNNEEGSYIGAWIMQYFKSEGYGILFNQIYNNDNEYYNKYISPILKKGYVAFPNKLPVVFKSFSEKYNHLNNNKLWYFTGLFAELI
ncbi:MAG: hypothetical protein CVU51_00750 [Deltaproteobacteria bacterium HGW-Deltaproteobacteria-1]|jgi:hypothetical protein|nr:MAG: hypothetical protein CVU51_00750 [Deltaproteobacteria bacterium HGW-Deltaproteobacteria-1]